MLNSYRIFHNCVHAGHKSTRTNCWSIVLRVECRVVFFFCRRRRLRNRTAYVRPTAVNANTPSQSTFDSYRDLHGHVTSRRGQWHQLRQTMASPTKLSSSIAAVWCPEIDSCVSAEQCQLVPSLPTNVERNCYPCCECGATCSSALQHCSTEPRRSAIFSVSSDAV